MIEYCYILKQTTKVGCTVKIEFVGVTRNQTDAYIWQQDVSDSGVRREAIQTIFLGT